MGIDGIGGPPIPGAPGAAGSVDATVRATESFRVEAGVSVEKGEGPFDRLRSGELTSEQYLEIRVEQAITPFLHTLGPEQLEFVRATLRERLQSDPMLVELARRATAGVGER